MSNHGYAEESWFDPRLEVRRSGIDGKGMFATQPIRAGDTVMVWGGIAFTLEEWVTGKVKLDPEAYTSSRIDDELYIAAPMDGMDHYINHSCDPNLWMQDNITVVARHDIQPGAEVTFDYATIEAHDDVRIAQCNCGAALCRGSVRGDDWLNPELQARYCGHFQPWIARMMVVDPLDAAPTEQHAEEAADGNTSSTAAATTAPGVPEARAVPEAQSSRAHVSTVAVTSGGQNAAATAAQPATPPAEASPPVATTVQPAKPAQAGATAQTMAGAEPMQAQTDGAQQERI